MKEDLSNVVMSDGRPAGASKTVKKPIIVVCIADKKNMPYARTMLKSLRHFHKDWPVMLVTDETENLPEGIIKKDLTNYIQDRMFFYRATPIVAEPLLDEYELVLKLDADQLVLGDLSYILDTTDYDVGTVINWNRYDEKLYPVIAFQGVFPAEYFNCGLVAMRSKKFVHDWKMLCFGTQFDRLQYKEQDLLNGQIYFGNWNVRCFDHPDPVKKYFAWHGLLAKGELNRAELRGKDIVIPKGLGDTPFPPTDEVLKVVHLGGGAEAIKDNWAAYFPLQVWEYIAKEIIK